MRDKAVEKMVDVLFEDLVMTDEVEAMRDEVMNNCQERYAGMVAEGYTEEDAAAAVMESLKGMDEVLRDYPRVTPIREEDFSKESRTGSDLDLSGVRALRIQVQSADVELMLGSGPVTMSLQDGTRTVLVPVLQGNTLVITQESKSEHGAEPIHPGSGFFSRLGRAISRSVGSVGDSDAKATVYVPDGLLDRADISSLSGDVNVCVTCGSLDLTSASGDVNVTLNPKSAFSGPSDEPCCEKLTAKSISGDVNVTGDAGVVMISTTSGDAQYRGAAGSLEISSVSGDAEANVESSRVTGSTVSGDLDIEIRCGEQAEVTMSTVSGDADLRFADNVKWISAKTSTRSGHVEFDEIGLSDSAPVKVAVKSVSGDISIGG